MRWFELMGEPEALAPFAGAIPSDGRALARRGELVARFGPCEQGDVRGDHLGDRARGHKLMYDHSAAPGAQPFFEVRSTYAARVLAARRLGPILEVYRLPAPEVSEPRPAQD